MTVRELMTGALMTAAPELGIVTDRDIRLNLPSKATSLSVWEINHLLIKLTVGQVMTSSVITAAKVLA
jgi:acetoin utilization protein AcuB